MKRRNVLACGLVAPLVSGCDAKRIFVLGWQEQVQLVDGQIVLLSVRYTYERMGLLPYFNRYEPSMLRSTHLSFVSDSPTLTFAREFPRHRVNALQRLDGHWYLILERRGGYVMSRTESGPKQLFGNDADGAGHKCLRVDSGELTPVSINLFTDESLTPNLLMDNSDAKVLSGFDGTMITLAQKSRYLELYPLQAAETKIKSRYDSVVSQRR